MSRKTNGGGRLPPIHRPDPKNPNEVYKVDHVTAANRRQLHATSKEIIVDLYNADLSKLLHKVYIPRTREMPDIVSYLGVYYVFYDTERKPPQYVEAMVASGSFHSNYKQENDDEHNKTE